MRALRGTFVRMVGAKRRGSLAFTGAPPETTRAPAATASAIHSWVRFAAPSSMRGPTSVPSSAGSPTFNCAAPAAKRVSNASAIDSWRKMRCTLMQTCPA